MTWRTLRATIVAAALVVSAACAGSGDDDDAAPARDESAAADETTTTAAPPAGDGDCPTATPTPVEGPAATAEPIGEADGVSVSAAVYPLPESEGDPWSQWGQGVVLPDGRFVSAVGDHLGRDGNSWFYEFDPATDTLTRTTDVATPLGHQPGDWGYGKVHAPMVLGPCDEVITATYWGTRTDLEIGGSYQGDHLIRYDPATHQVTSLGVPVPAFGIPSLAISPDGRWIVGEAVDATSPTEDDSGVVFVADAATGEVAHVDDDPDHVGFRAVLVSPGGGSSGGGSPGGEAFTAAPGGGLFGTAPESGEMRRIDGVLPGERLRAASPAAPDGSVYGATVEPDALFRFAPDGTVTDLGEIEAYTASLGLSPDGSTLYYLPGAHGDAYTGGAPLVAVDTATGEHRTIAELQDLVGPALDLRVGGTYDLVVDPSGERIYIGVNAGPLRPASEDEDDTFGTVVLLVVDLP